MMCVAALQRRARESAMTLNVCLHNDKKQLQTRRHVESRTGTAVRAQKKKVRWV